jgi:NTE family protein
MAFFVAKKSLPTKNKKVKIGLALGGGATRGIAHIGVLKAFEENNIHFDYVSGTSVGSLVGAMYCAGKTADEMIDIAHSIRVKDIRKSKFFMPSKTDGIEELVRDNLGDVDIKKFKIPFSAVAVDLISGNEIVFSKGNVAKVVAGSCAVPGVFVPVEYKGYHLSDGGLQNNIPSDVPRYFGCDYVVAVDVNSTRGEGTDSLKVLDVLLATVRIMCKSNVVKGYMNADIVIKPSLKKYKSSKLDEVDAMLAEGYMAGLDAVEEILKLASKKPKRIYKKKIEAIIQNKPEIV